MNKEKKPEELVTECISSLTDFRFLAKTEGEKYVELFRKWSEEIADLEKKWRLLTMLP